MHKLLSFGLALFAAAAFACGTSSVAPPNGIPVDAPDASSDSDAASSSGSDAATAADAATADAGTSDGGNPLVTQRPYRLYKPASYSDTGPAVPFVLLLHGYGASGQVQDSYFGLSTLADAKGFLLATPDGTLDASGKRFWNASDACCNFGGVNVDDVAYLNAILDDVTAHHRVDPKRIFVVGHSNGGFMAHRFACEASDRVAGIVSLAGAAWKDTSKCKPNGKPAVLQVHGDADATVYYAGGQFFAGGPSYPSAADTVGMWAALDGCGATIQATGTTLDLVSDLPGKETRVDRFTGCTGGAVELWTIENGSHIPAFNTSWAGAFYDFLSAHPKP